MFVVYALVETRPGHKYLGVVRYVGQTNNLDRRISDYRKGRGNNRKHTNWLRACKEFDVRVLAQCETRDDAYLLEIAHIANLKTFRTRHGLNMHTGGSIGDLYKGRVLSPAHKKKVSRARKGRPNTPEQRKKISKKLKGRRKSSATRQRMSAASKLRMQDPKTYAMLHTRWSCDVCGMVSTAGGIFNHQRAKDHHGKSIATDT